MEVTPGVVLNKDHTAANLHAMVDSATFSNLELGDFLETEKPIAKTGTEPSAPEVGQTWFLPNSDSSSSYPAAQFFIWDGMAWRFGGMGLSMINGSGSTLYKGVWVGQKAGSAGSFDAGISVSSFPHRILGVLAEDSSNGDTSLIITHGFCKPIVQTSGVVIGGALFPVASGAVSYLSATLGAVQQGCMGRLLAIDGDAVTDGLYTPGVYKRMWAYLTGQLKVTL